MYIDNCSLGHNCMVFVGYSLVIVMSSISSIVSQVYSQCLAFEWDVMEYSGIHNIYIAWFDTMGISAMEGLECCSHGQNPWNVGSSEANRSYRVDDMSFGFMGFCFLNNYSTL